LTVVYKQFRAETKVDAAGVITATLSTEAEDRDGDVIRASGWQLDHFLKHPVLMANHDYSIRSQIGEWKNVRVEGGALLGEPNFYEGKGNEDADWAAELCRRGRAAFSVGFVPVESTPRKGHAGNEFTKQELLEISVVAVPSNREALQLALKSARPGPVREIAAELLAEQDEPAHKDAGQPCAVAGCAGTCSAQLGVCAGHLRSVADLEAEQKDADRPEAGALRVLRGWTRRQVKAGRTLSGANMTHVHEILDAAHALHDAGDCRDADCPYNTDADEPEQAKGARRKYFTAPEGSAEDLIADLNSLIRDRFAQPGCPSYDPYSLACPVDVCATYIDGLEAGASGYCIAEAPSADGDPCYYRCPYTIGDDLEPVLGDCEPVELTFTTTAKYVTRATGEGSGAAGGVTVAEDGTHAAFSGTHTHSHAAFGSQGGDQSHAHQHSHDGDADHDHSHSEAAEKTAKKPLSTAAINDLPDSAFALILPGGKKDSDGKTTPRDLRVLPHHKADGSLDLPHLKSLLTEKNALARVSQADLTDEQRAEAEKHLEAHAKDAGIGEAADGGKAFDAEAFAALIEAALAEAAA
jgi:hypothetical protein